MTASTSENWQPRPSRSSRLAAVLVVGVLVALAGAFYWLEQERSRKQVAESMHVHRNQDGMIDLVRFETDEVTQRHWEELRPAASTLRTLHLSRTTSVAGGLAAIGEFTNLETLFLLECAWVDDHQLAQLSGLKLSHLNLARTPVTDRGLAAIDLSRLRILDLSGCAGVTDAGLDRLHGGDALTNVLLEGTSITLDGFERLRLALPEAKLQLKEGTLIQTFCKVDGGSPWLENRGEVDTLLRFFSLPHNWSAGTYSPPSGAPFMTLKGPAVGPALADILAAMPNSNTVMLAQTSIPGGFEAASDSVRRIQLSDLTDEVDLSSLASVTSLEQLEIHATTIPEGELSFLGDLPRLRYLDLSGSQVSEANLQMIARCESLENVGIASTPVPQGALSFLPELPRLKSLRLSNCQVSTVDLQTVGRCVSLENLGISSTIVPAGALNFLPRLSRLRTLTLYRIHLSETDLLRVAQCESLERIDLRDVAVSDEAVLAIAKLPNLQALWFSAANVSQELPGRIRSEYPHVQLHAE